MNTIKSLVYLVIFVFSQNISCSSTTDSYMYDHNKLVNDNHKPIIYCDNDQFSKTHDVEFKPITIMLEDTNGGQVTKYYRTIRAVQIDLYKYFQTIDRYDYNTYDIDNFYKLFAIIKKYKAYEFDETDGYGYCFKNADEYVKEKIEDDNALTAALEDLGL